MTPQTAQTRKDSSSGRTPGGWLIRRWRAHAVAVDPKLRVLAGVPALRTCPALELQLIARITEVLDRPAGTRLATCGRPLAGLWCLLAGTAAVASDDDLAAALLTRPAISPVDAQLRATLTVHALTSVRILEVATHDLRRWEVPALQAMLLGPHTG